MRTEEEAFGEQGDGLFANDGLGVYGDGDDEGEKLLEEIAIGDCAEAAECAGALDEVAFEFLLEEVRDHNESLALAVNNEMRCEEGSQLELEVLHSHEVDDLKLCPANGISFHGELEKRWALFFTKNSLSRAW